MNEIKMISIKELHPHPDNPRKTLGDLTELSESIRKNGIMQNLTVVEGHYKGKEYVQGGYTIIIGHRRCAAAHQAGIKELPCFVADLDLQQQLCTMMEENMQREDLSVPEQAYGFQYMLDMGVTVKEMARRTGFAESTVKHRLEIAKLDRKVLKGAMENESWQMTINDFKTLEKVKDVKKREEIIKRAAADRRGFAFAVERAVEDEKANVNEEKWKAIFEESGIKQAPKNVQSWTFGWKEIGHFDLVSEKVPKKLDLKALKGYDENKPAYSLRQYNRIYLMQKEDEKTDGLDSYEAEQKRKEKIRKQINTKAKAATQEMQHFATNAYYGVRPESSLSESETIERLWELFRITGAAISRHSVSILYPEKKNWEVLREEEEEALELMAQLKVSEQMLIFLSSTWDKELADYLCEYRTDAGEDLMLTYMTLQELYGFRFTDSEFLQVINGTHELYMKEEKDSE